MERYLCIHGHFYQPPRENPWLEAIEIQDSAYPYHDWNERVTAECYAPNSASRILDDDGYIVEIINNYGRMSFNFGPTLLAWMERYTPDIYRTVIEADRQSVEMHGGHGNALAQVYNHMIMPLAHRRDKRTQVIWGVRDFQHRFGRLPEGMWLAETGVDLETLDIMAAQGIAFTVLEPHQASRTRKLRSGRWQDVSGGRIDPTRPYALRLPSGRSIALFFYDGPISRAVAFERLLNRGEDFARRLLSGYSDHRPWAQLMHIATDGETYGHHHKFGDMALAYAFRLIEANGSARLTNYGEYLAMYPPTTEVQIVERSSWSCVHGIERWRSDCGCNSGGHPGWHQRWRRPLRQAFDWLRDELAVLMEEEGREYFKDPWRARDDYVDVVLDRSKECVDSFLAQHGLDSDEEARKAKMLRLMEIQRHAMLMYTSCGWFFDEISGIETVQVMRYAARAVQLASEVFHVDLTSSLKERLGEAESNLPEHRTGADIYAKFVEPGIIRLEKVAAHYGVRSVREDYAEVDRVYAFSVRREDYLKTTEAGRSLVIGRIRLVSDITLDARTISFCVVHLGGPIFNGGVRAFLGQEAYTAMKEQSEIAFRTGNIPDLVRLMDSNFGMHNYSLADLFRDEQRTMLNLILDDTLRGLEGVYRHIYEENRLLMEFVKEGGMPIPREFLVAAEFGLNAQLRTAILSNNDQRERIKGIMKDMNQWEVKVDPKLLEIESRRRLESLLTKLSIQAWDLGLLQEISHNIEAIRAIPLDVNLWTMQNLYFDTARRTWHEYLARSGEGDKMARAWVDEFRKVGELLAIKTDKMLK